jgi:hypothetical protein
LVYAFKKKYGKSGNKGILEKHLKPKTPYSLQRRKELHFAFQPLTSGLAFLVSLCISSVAGGRVN